MSITLNAEAVRVFAEVGYLGLSRGAFDEAQTIFDMLSAFRPGEEAGAIGAGMVALATGATDRAIDVLRNAEQTPAVMAFLAVAYAKFGARDLARDVAEELEAMDADQDLVTIAKGALAEPQ